MRERKFRRPEAGGFTLIEVLIAVVLLGLIAIAVAAISITGVLQISKDNTERQLDATTAQWASLVLARDVQGASRIVTKCPSSPVTHLVTLESSVDSSRRVEYRRVAAGDGTFKLVRVEWPEGCDGAALESVVIEGLRAPSSPSGPTVRCDATDCDPDVRPKPRRVTLVVSRTDEFGFTLDGARRTTKDDSLADPPPLERPDFVSLGGDKPLVITGSSKLEIRGSAFINRPTDGSACDDQIVPGPSCPVDSIIFQGGGIPDELDDRPLKVTGRFLIQRGGECDQCSTHANPANPDDPGEFVRRLLDPLAGLKPPTTETLTARSDCPVGLVGTLERRICQPGIYDQEFPPSSGGGGGVKDYVLEPGVYVLKDGIRLPNGTMEGSGVLLYNQLGAIDIQGGEFNLSPTTSDACGDPTVDEPDLVPCEYKGILLFQARSNPEKILINGNADLALITGTMYAPMCTPRSTCPDGSVPGGFVLGGGGGTLQVGRVIGASLTTFGNGTVIVDGS